MINKGIVKKIEDDIIFIELFKDSACSSCSSCSNKTCNTQKFKYTKKDLKVSDIVELHSSNSFILKLSFLIYIIPLIFMIGGYYFSDSILKLSEAFSIFMSFFFLILSMFFLFLVDKYKGAKFEEKITIKKESKL